MVCASSLDDLRWAFRARVTDFSNAPDRGCGPAVRAHLGAVEGLDGAYLLITVRHSLSDGLSFAPICRDFLLIYNGMGDNLSPMVTDSRVVLENRLKNGIFCSSTDKNQNSLRSSVFDDQRKHQVNSNFHTLKISEDLTRLFMSQTTKQLNVSFDVLLIALVTLACSRADQGSAVAWTMVAPMRDELNDQNLVGLVTDWRTMEFVFTQDMTVFSAVLYVNEKIRNRSWEVYDPCVSRYCGILNVISLETVGNLSPPETDFSTRFEQVHMDSLRPAKPSGESGNAEWTKRREGSKRPNRDKLVTIEQTEAGSWFINLQYCPMALDPFWVREFSVQFNRSVNEVLRSPITGVFEKLADSDFLELARGLGMLYKNCTIDDVRGARYRV